MTDDTFSELLDLARSHSKIMFIGATDTGKSTLIRSISSKIEATIIDTDIGQSEYGPPTVVTLAEPFNRQYHAVDGYFCGSTTPAGHFLQVVAGASRMVRRSKTRPVLINTMGLATGDTGMALKTQKINALEPDLIIAIYRASELNYLRSFEKEGIEVLWQKIGREVREKSKSERTYNRRKAFADHFQGAAHRVWPFEKVLPAERSLLGCGEIRDTEKYGIEGLEYVEAIGDELLVAVTGNYDVPGLIEQTGARTMHVLDQDDIVGLLIGLIDKYKNFLGLGIISSIDFKNRHIEIYSPVTEFSAVQFGSIKLNGDYEYAGRYTPRVYRA